MDIGLSEAWKIGKYLPWDIPDAKYPRTSVTVMHMPRMQGFPLRLPGSMVMMSR